MARIRFLKAYKGYRPGDEEDIGSPRDELLVWGGVAEWVKEVVECAAEEPPENAMEAKPKKRKPQRTRRTQRKAKKVGVPHARDVEAPKL